VEAELSFQQCFLKLQKDLDIGEEEGEGVARARNDLGVADVVWAWVAGV